jgi:hypothetical protein
MKTTIFTLLFVLIMTTGCAGFIRGPFGGKVIDAETKEPIEGAVVVVVWSKDVITGSPGGPASYIEEIKETLTDKNGNYFIEKYHGFTISPLSKIQDPEFLVFKSGYCVLPETLSMPSCKDMKPIKNYYEVMTKEEALIELPRLNTFEDRRSARVSPFGDKKEWKKQKLFIKALRKEYEYITGQPAGNLYQVGGD